MVVGVGILVNSLVLGFIWWRRRREVARRAKLFDTSSSSTPSGKNAQQPPTIFSEEGSLFGNSEQTVGSSPPSRVPPSLQGAVIGTRVSVPGAYVGDLVASPLFPTIQLPSVLGTVSADMVFFPTSPRSLLASRIVPQALPASEASLDAGSISADLVLLSPTSTSLVSTSTRIAPHSVPKSGAGSDAASMSADFVLLPPTSPRSTAKSQPSLRNPRKAGTGAAGVFGDPSFSAFSRPAPSKYQPSSRSRVYARPAPAETAANDAGWGEDEGYKVPLTQPVPRRPARRQPTSQPVPHSVPAHQTGGGKIFAPSDSAFLPMQSPRSAAHNNMVPSRLVPPALSTYQVSVEEDYLLKASAFAPPTPRQPTSRSKIPSLQRPEASTDQGSQLRSDDTPPQLPGLVRGQNSFDKSPQQRQQQQQQVPLFYSENDRAPRGLAPPAAANLRMKTHQPPGQTQ